MSSLETFRKSILSKIERLVNIFNDLVLAQNRFLDSEIQQTKLIELLDLRDFVFEEVKAIEKELLTEYLKITTEPYEIKSLGELIIALEKNEILAEGNLAALITALKEFFAGQQKITEKLNKEKTTLLDSIKAIRKGSSLLKGYSVPGDLESCFIDKIR